MLFSSGTASIITTMPSLASLCGKLVWGGWPVDRWGPRKTYVGSMVALAGLVLLYTSPAIISSWHAVAALAFAVEFAGIVVTLLLRTTMQVVLSVPAAPNRCVCDGDICAQDALHIRRIFNLFAVGGLPIEFLMAAGYLGCRHGQPISLASHYLAHCSRFCHGERVHC